MVLTPEQIEEARKKYKVTAPAETTGVEERVNEVKNLWETADTKAEAFRGPLDRIREGKAGDNVEVAKGAAKQAVKEIVSVGAHKAGPVGAQMMADAKKRGGGAAKFAEALEDLDEKIEPKGALQKKGARETIMATIVAPTPKVAKAVVPAAKVVKKTVDAAKGALRGPNAALEDAIEVTSPVRYKKESIAAMEKAGQPGGAETKGWFSKKYVPTPSQRDIDVARSVQDIVSRKKGPIDNIVAVNKGIESESAALTEHFANNKVPFNFEDLRDAANLVTPDASLKADASALETYNRVRENMLSTMYNQLRNASKNADDFGSQTDMSILWDARKVIDEVIEKELGTATFGSPQYTGVKAAARDFRNSFNKFIAENIANPGQMEQVNLMNEFLQVSRARGIDIPDEQAAMDILRKQFGLKGSTDEALARAAVFRDTMDKLTRMYEARGNIAESNYRLLDKNVIQRWIKQNPAKAEVIKYLVGIGGVGALVNSMTN